jgi:2'-5' RNA ligase
LFFALWPSAAQRDAMVAATAQAVTAAREAGGRPIPPENLHITLMFLGAVSAEGVAAVVRVGAGIRGSRLAGSFDRVEFWPASRVVCAVAALTDGAEFGAPLASTLARDCAAQGVLPRLDNGNSQSVKPFRSHVTLARDVSRVSGSLTMRPVALEFAHFALIESRPGTKGSIYSVVESWPLYSE